jgi:hypothetical protein
MGYAVKVDPAPAPQLSCQIIYIYACMYVYGEREIERDVKYIYSKRRRAQLSPKTNKKNK